FPQFISTKILQLTEWVYKFITSAHSSNEEISSKLRIFYKKCLDWYTEILAVAEKDFGRTPFVLFVQPLTNVYIEDPGIGPHRICNEAAQSILALVQSYDDLFTLHRVSGLMPYFVCAAGLLGIAMETNCKAMKPVHLRLKHDPPGNTARPIQEVSVIKFNDPPATSSYITMSATDHARQLLAKMSSTHLAAKIAENQLEASPGNSGDM
ncbi:Zn(2)-Cys(6) zinc finger domain protein, partial [Metarhizium robertsii]